MTRLLASLLRHITAAITVTLTAGALLSGCGTGAGKPVTRVHTAGDAQSACAGPQWRLLGEVRWNVETQYGGVPVGGLSSIDWDAARGDYLLVSDDRAVHGPARFYSAHMRYDAAGLHEVWLTGMHVLQAPDRKPHERASHARAGVAVPDAEALRVVPGSDAVIWASEGDAPRGFGPELNAVDRDGQWLFRWPLPDALSQPAAASGPRAGFSIEGLSFSDDGSTLWMSMEGALKQDGSMPSPGNAGAPVRITAFDAKTHLPVRQIAYQPDALRPDIWALPQRAVNGVSEILVDGPHHLLVLERSFSVDFGWSARLHRIDTRTATDTLGMARLEPGRFQPARKQRLLDFSTLGLRSVDNLEGMTWGPRLASGQRVLLLVSDNNFNPAQVTQFIALAEVSRCTSE